MDGLREKVVKGLKICEADLLSKDTCKLSGCPYADIPEGTLTYKKCRVKLMEDALSLLKAQEPDESKYEYHTDHTDCQWYITGEERKCPVTCSQYRDGWNDAMNYIFRNGDGYSRMTVYAKGGGVR